MNNNTKIIAAIVVVAILIGGYLYFSSAATISVEGNSVVKAEPDEINVQILIQTKNASLVDAQSANSALYTSVVNGLKGIGFSDSDIKLESFNSYPDYTWDGYRQKDNGYIVTRQLSVNLKDFNKVDDVIDNVGSSGAVVSYINFELSQQKQNELKAQALKEAGQDAKVKADAVASGFGKHLGSLVSIELADFRYNPYPVYANSGTYGAGAVAEAKSAVADISPQNLEVPATVRAVYKVRAF